MFFQSTFEPHSTTEPQWFPRPITNSHESSLDALERAEEERKMRLHKIANVSARVPIGFGPGSAAGNSGMPIGTPGHVPGPSSSSVFGTGSQAYANHRYYPPPSPSSASLYAREGTGNDRFITTPPPVSSTTRRIRYRRTNTPRSAVSGASSAYSGGSISYSRNVAFTSGSAFSAVRPGGDTSVDVGSARSGVVGATANNSHDNESFGAATSSFLGVSSPLFQSPMVASGGQSPWQGQQHPPQHLTGGFGGGDATEESMQQQQSSYYGQEYPSGDQSQYGSVATPRNASTMMTTPPPINHAPRSTRRIVDSGRSSDDRDHGQRRSRRRGWEEVNEP